MDLGLVCINPCGPNRMPLKMLRKMMAVFVVNYVHTVIHMPHSHAHVSVAHVI